MDFMVVAAICAICMLVLGLILMAVAVVAALIPLIAPVRRNRGQEQPTRKGTAGARWFHWLFVCGVLLFILGIGLVFLYDVRFDLNALGDVYGPWALFLVGLLVVLLTIAARWGITAGARHSVWVFILAATTLVLFMQGYVPTSVEYADRCRRNLKMVGLALIMYADDNDDVLPPANRWKEAVRLGIGQLSPPQPSVHKMLHCPLTKKPYIFNDRLAGKRIEDIAHPTGVPLAWDAPDRAGRAPHTGVLNRTRSLNVVFLDGHGDWWMTKDLLNQLIRSGDSDAKMP